MTSIPGVRPCPVLEFSFPWFGFAFRTSSNPGNIVHVEHVHQQVNAPVLSVSYTVHQRNTQCQTHDQNNQHDHDCSTMQSSKQTGRRPGSLSPHQCNAQQFPRPPATPHATPRNNSAQHHSNCSRRFGVRRCRIQQPKHANPNTTLESIGILWHCPGSLLRTKSHMLTNTGQYLNRKAWVPIRDLSCKQRSIALPRSNIEPNVE